MSFTEITAIIMVLMISFTGTAAFRVSVPAVAFYTRQILETTALGVGLLTSSFFAGRALFAVITGGISDRYRKKIIYLAIICFAVNALVVSLYSYADNITEVILIRALQGALNGTAWVSIQVILGSIVRTSIRGRVYSIYFASGTLGNVIANTLYSHMANNPLSTILVVSSGLFLMASLLCVGVSLLLPSILREDIIIRRNEKKGSNIGEPISGLAAIPIALIILGTSMFTSIVRGDLIYIYMNEGFNLLKSDVANVIAITSLLALLGGYLISWISDRISDVLALRMATVIGFLGALSISVRSIVVVLIGLILYYIANSAVISISRRVAITYYRLGGTFMGIINAIGNIGSITGSSIAGIVYDAYGLSTISIGGVHFTGFVFIISMIVAIPVVCSFLLLKTQHR